jgi:hypothetical protein
MARLGLTYKTCAGPVHTDMRNKLRVNPHKWIRKLNIVKRSFLSNLLL